MKQLFGADISHWQNTIDWSKVDWDFVIIKASEGLTGVDPMFKKNQAEARNKGIKLGFYHFSDSFDPIKEADHFLSVVGPIMAGEFLCLDAETGQSEAYCKAFLDHLQAETGFAPLIYAPVSSWLSALPYPLWVARYGRNNGQMNLDQPPHIGPWKEWTIWQYSSANNLDLDVANDLSGIGKPISPTGENGPAQPIPAPANPPEAPQTIPTLAPHGIDGEKILPPTYQTLTNSKNQWKQLLDDLIFWIKNYFKQLFG